MVDLQPNNYINKIIKAQKVEAKLNLLEEIFIQDLEVKFRNIQQKEDFMEALNLMEIKNCQTRLQSLKQQL